MTYCGACLNPFVQDIARSRRLGRKVEGEQPPKFEAFNMVRWN